MSLLQYGGHNKLRVATHRQQQACASFRSWVLLSVIVSLGWAGRSKGECCAQAMGKFM